MFHKPKSTKTEIDSAEIAHRRYLRKLNQRFQDRVLQLIREQELNESVASCDLRGFHFGDLLVYDQTFTKPVDLTDARFTGDARFQNVVFERKLEFAFASFDHQLTFQGCVVEDDLGMESCAFRGPVMFASSKFKGANFSGARFEGTTYFTNCDFEAYVIFDRVGFGEKSKVQFSCVEGSRPSFRKEISFCDLRLSEGCTVTLEKVSLSKARFLDTNVEVFDFRDVVWAQRPRSWRTLFLGKRCLWDEIRPLNTIPLRIGGLDYEKTAENYRQLVLNHERKRDFEAAEEFHLGEMEMLRKKRGEGAKRFGKLMKEWLNAYGLYRLLSVYGTSYWWAIGVLGLLVLLFGLVFMWSGFWVVEGDGSRRIIMYVLSCEPARWAVGSASWFRDLAEAVVFSISPLTLQRGRFYEPNGLLTRFLYSVATLFLAAQLALVLLAIRRRFKR